MQQQLVASYRHTRRRRVGTVRCAETRRRHAGYRACGVFAVRQSLEVAHVVDLPPDAPKIASFYGRSSSSSAHARSRRNYAVDRDGAAIYRTLADIPCRPGFVCTSYMRYNRSSALQVYSQCAFDLRRDSRCRRLPTASWCRLWSRTAYGDTGFFMSLISCGFYVGIE